MEAILSLIDSVQPRVMVEFGVNIGLTARTVLGHIRSIERYIGVDVEPGYVPSKPIQRNEGTNDPGQLVNDDSRFNLILRQNGSLDLTASDLPPCDVVFIDGDHGREAVMHDSALARSISRAHGIIIWHDYHDRPVVDVAECLDELHSQGRDIKHIADTWIAFERIEPPPPVTVEVPPLEMEEAGYEF